MLRNVYLEGELQTKFGKKFSVDATTLQEVLRCADVNFDGFRKYMIDAVDEDLGFTIDVADSRINYEEQLLLPLKPGDITITPVAAGSKSVGKIIAAIAIAYFIVQTGGAGASAAAPAEGAAAAGAGGAGAAGAQGAAAAKTAVDAQAAFAAIQAPTGTSMLAAPSQTLGQKFAAGMAKMGWKGKMLGGLSLSLGMQGLNELMAPDPSGDGDQESSYMFNGSEQNIIEGDPVPVLYGELRVPGQPISFDAISASHNPITQNSGTATGSQYLTWENEMHEVYLDWSTLNISIG